MARQDGSSVRLYGHVYDQLDEFRGDDESFNDAVLRLLPEHPEVIEIPEDEAKMIWLSPVAHSRVMNSAGENVAASDVIEHYLDKHE